MPMYEYACAACGHQDTLLEKYSAAKSKKCPSCSKQRQFKRQLSAPSFQLKGTGWYVTDFRDKGPKPASAESSDSKPATKTAKDNGKVKETKSDKVAKPTSSKQDSTTAKASS